MLVESLLDRQLKTGHHPLRDEVTFIDRGPHWYSRRVKEAIHIRLHPNNINRDSGMNIPEAWMPTSTQHNSQLPPQRTAEGSVSSSDNTKNTGSKPTNHERGSGYTNY